MTKSALQRKIERLQREISELGRLRPGTMYERLNVCGRPGCKCGRAKKPEKHGPYQYLSYTFRGKSYTEFVRQEDVAKVREQVTNYDRLMALVGELVETNIGLSRLERGRK